MFLVLNLTSKCFTCAVVMVHDSSALSGLKAHDKAETFVATMKAQSRPPFHGSVDASVFDSLTIAHAAAWLIVTPSASMGYHLNPSPPPHSAGLMVNTIRFKLFHAEDFKLLN